MLLDSIFNLTAFNKYIMSKGNAHILRNLIMAEYICKYCRKQCGNSGGLTSHEHCCKFNPDRKSYYHSPNAGRKTGKDYYVWNKGLTKETDEKIMELVLKLKEKYKNGLIIPSFKGKKHSLETKNKISKATKSRYKNGWDNICGRAKKYKYTMKDGSIITVDGSWEYHVAEYLDRNNINWKRNTDRFEYINLKGNKSTYKPDFYLIDTNEYLEIKGYETDLDRCKWQQFPNKLLVWKKQDLIDKGISIKKIGE